MKTLSMVSSDLWDTVLADVNKAVVFLDNATAENLHWSGGLSSLVDAGALDVKELSSFESAKVSQKKAVFITSCSLNEATTKEKIQDIVKSSQLQYVIIITTVSPRMHQYHMTGSFDGDVHTVFDSFEEEVLEWMGNMNYTVEIKYVPVVMSVISTSTFIMPAYSELFPLLETDVKQLKIQCNSKRADKRQFETLDDLDSSCLPPDLLNWYKGLISCIDSLLSELGVNEDCYSLGPTSRILATELANYTPAKNRRKNAQNKASILFVDRTLDTATPCSRQTETLFDRIVAVLPRLPGHNNDVLVDMSMLCNVHSDASSTVLPGCLASFSGQQQHLTTLLTSKLKEGTMDVNRQLVDAASKEKLPIKLTGKPGRVTADQLQSSLLLFKGKYDLILKHINILQNAMATYKMLKGTRNQQLESLGGVEKLIVQGYSEEMESMDEVLKLMKSEIDKEPSERSYSLDDIFCLLVFVYSVYGTSIGDDREEEVKAELVRFILKERNCLPPLTQKIVGSTINTEIVTTMVDDAWDKLIALSTARSNLKQLDSICEESALGPTQLQPLLKQLINVIFDPNKPELQDIELKSSGFGDLLKSGFGLFRSVAKPRPSDHPLLILFVVGGITSTELKQIKDSISSLKLTSQVIVGSTRLVTPEDITSSILYQDRINRT